MQVCVCVRVRVCVCECVSTTRTCRVLQITNSQANTCVSPPSLLAARSPKSQVRPSSGNKHINALKEYL